MNNNNNQLGLGATLKYGNGKKSSLEVGMVDSNPTAPYNSNNSITFYDSKTKQKVTAIACVIDCPFNVETNKTQQNENNALAESTNQPFTYQDSNITAKEIINDDNTSTLIIESNTNLLEYQGNTADTLMAGISGVFNSMATLAGKTKERIA